MKKLQTATLTSIPNTIFILYAPHTKLLFLDCHMAKWVGQSDEGPISEVSQDRDHFASKRNGTALAIPMKSRVRSQKWPQELRVTH
jgi:hypothetical protein